jgi:soluble lytic murein transglycosylase-like protein
MRAKIRLIALLHLAGFGTVAHAQVFGGQDASGAVVLSNFQSEAASTLLVSAPVVPTAPSTATANVPASISPPPSFRIASVPERLLPIIQDAAREHALPPNLIQAVIAVESGYNPNAVSRTGAKGLMQLMPQTANRFGVADVYDQRANVRGGAQYLNGCSPLLRATLNLHSPATTQVKTP